MRATRHWALAGALLALACSNRAAWNHDESARISEAMRTTPLSSSEARGISMGAAPPLAKGPGRSPGYSLEDLPASRPGAKLRRSKPARRKQ